MHNTFIIAQANKFCKFRVAINVEVTQVLVIVDRMDHPSPAQEMTGSALLSDEADLHQETMFAETSPLALAQAAYMDFVELRAVVAAAIDLALSAAQIVDR